jgi:hypothetical protein
VCVCVCVCVYKVDAYLNGIDLPREEEANLGVVGRLDAFWDVGAVCVCVCVCNCERGREERRRENITYTHTHTHLLLPAAWCNIRWASVRESANMPTRISGFARSLCVCVCV